MNTETKILGGIVVLTIALLAGGAVLLGRGQTNSTVSNAGERVSIDYSIGQKIGSDSARVKVVEFSDFQCPACAAAEPAVKNVLSSYPDSVQFIYRHFPLPQHLNAKMAAAVAEAAGEQGKFWQMHDKLFETQENWSNLGDPLDFFLELAKQLELDEGKIKEAANNNIYTQKIESDLEAGRSLGVNSTPTFYINGTKANLKNFADLKTLVEGQLNSTK